MNSIKFQWRQKIEELFGADLRSLALMRICLATIILIDLVTRLPDLAVFYTDAGLYPRASMIDRYPHVISLHLMNGTVLGQGIIFFLHFLCTLGLLIGYKTRVMTILSWFLLSSLQWRILFILGAGDIYLRVLLFWCIFLPMGARFSLDSLLDPSSKEKPVRINSWAVIAFIAQCLIVYVESAIFKWRDPSWSDGTAIYYTLNIFNYAKDSASYLLLHPDLMKLLTQSVIWLEMLGPLIFFIPFRTALARMIGIVLFLGLQLGFYLSLYLKTFPWVSASALLIFLPTAFWDHLPAKVTTFFGHWSEILQKKSHKIISFLPKEKLNVRPGILMEALVLFFIFCTLYSSIGTLTGKRTPAFVSKTMQITSLSQHWALFTPPSKRSGWIVVPGKLNDGTMVDLYQNGDPVNWERPELDKINKNPRWQRFVMNNYVFGRNVDNRVDFARYLCRSWNGQHQGLQHLQSLEIFFMNKTTPPPGGKETIKKERVLNMSCAEAVRSNPVKSRALRSDQIRKNSAGPPTMIIPDPSRPLTGRLPSFPPINKSAGTSVPTDRSAVALPSILVSDTSTFDYERAYAKAGSFYPRDPVELRQEIRGLLDTGEALPLRGDVVAILVPHAAIKFSGPVAAGGFKNIRKDFETVVLIGPAHKVPTPVAALWPRGSFKTPLGEIPVDEALARELLGSSKLILDLPTPHLEEHSLEVELPFLQEHLGSFKIVPILISAADLTTYREVGEAIGRALKGKNALIVISSDLSHYPDHDSAQRIDSTTLNAITQMDPETILRTAEQLKEQYQDILKVPMCGQGAFLTGLYAAKFLGADNAQILKYDDSSWTKDGDPKRVVGYASVAFTRSSSSVQPSPQPKN